METTRVKIIIDEDMHKTDRRLIGYVLESAINCLDAGEVEDSITDDPEVTTIYATVDYATYSALCVMEDRGLLMVQQR